MSAIFNADIANCRNQQHKFRPVWSDKTPMRVSLLCVTCTDMRGQSTYVAFGIDTASWGQWRRKRREEDDES